MRDRGRRLFPRVCVALSALTIATAIPAQAEGPAREGVLGLELNTAVDAETACRLTFVIDNALGVDIAALVLEVVVFTTDGAVDRLTLFDYQSLPSGRPRVRQFDLGGVACDGLTSILINGISTCDGETLTPEVCQAALRATSRAPIEVQG